MNHKKLLFSLLTLITFNFQGSEAAQNGNESGQNLTRNLFEYNLYDRNRDRLRGRGIYGEEEEAYPNEYQYIQRENDRHFEAVQGENDSF